MKVYRYPDEMLGMICSEVTKFDLELHTILDKMAETMKEENGIGLSANQVGYSLRMFVALDKTTGEVIDVVNPIITHASESMVAINEGCLSAPGVFIKIPRHQHIIVKFQDRNGEEWVSELGGIESVCFQHELDHLNGITFFKYMNRQQKRAAIKKLRLKR